jgi:hypothetical protein
LFREKIVYYCAKIAVFGEVPALAQLHEAVRGIGEVVVHDILRDPDAGDETVTPKTSIGTRVYRLRNVAARLRLHLLVGPC